MRMRRLSTTALVPVLGLMLMAFGGRAVFAARRIRKAACAGSGESACLREVGPPFRLGSGFRRDRKYRFCDVLKWGPRGQPHTWGRSRAHHDRERNGLLPSAAALLAEGRGTACHVGQADRPGLDKHADLKLSRYGRQLSDRATRFPGRLDHHRTNDRGPQEGRWSRCCGCQILERQCVLDCHNRNAISDFRSATRQEWWQPVVQRLEQF